MSLKYVLVKYAHASITVNDTQTLLNVKYSFKYFPQSFPKGMVCGFVLVSGFLIPLLYVAACWSGDLDTWVFLFL